MKIIYENKLVNWKIFLNISKFIFLLHVTVSTKMNSDPLRYSACD